jgi:hypothetical protein
MVSASVVDRDHEAAVAARHLTIAKAAAVDVNQASAMGLRST